MHRMTLILAAFLWIPDVYIYLVHVAGKSRNILLRLCWWAPGVLLSAFYIYYMYLCGDNTLADHAPGIGRLAVGILLFAVSKAVFMLCSSAGVLAHTLFRRCPRMPFNAAGLLLSASCAACIAYGSLWGIRRFEVERVEYGSARLPAAFDGYRIVQISDIHIGSWKNDPASVRKMVEMANAEKADLIVFTGDLVNQQGHELDGFQGILSRLHAPDGVWSVLGNHDYGTYYHWPSAADEKRNLDYLAGQQKAMGWRLLDNEFAIIRHNGDSIALIGVGNDGEPPFSQHADLPRATQGTEGMFSILLSHNPTHWRREVLPQSDIDLMLAGHTHAMQLILFGHSPSALRYPEWKGMYREGRRALYVNTGIGHVGLPFRFGAWPEITVIELKREE